MTKNISLMNLVRIFIRRKTFFRACGRARKFFARAGKATLRKQHSKLGVYNRWTGLVDWTGLDWNGLDSKCPKRYYSF